MINPGKRLRTWGSAAQSWCQLPLTFARKVGESLISREKTWKIANFNWNFLKFSGATLRTPQVLQIIFLCSFYFILLFNYVTQCISFTWCLLFKKGCILQKDCMQNFVWKHIFFYIIFSWILSNFLKHRFGVRIFPKILENFN